MTLTDRAGVLKFKVRVMGKYNKDLTLIDRETVAIRKTESSH